MALCPRLQELSASWPVISLQHGCAVRGGPREAVCAPLWLRSCPGKEAEALLGRGACALSPHQGFGDGIWVIPGGTHLPGFNLILVRLMASQNQALRTSSSITGATTTLAPPASTQARRLLVGGSVGSGDTLLPARHAVVRAAGWGAVSC